MDLYKRKVRAESTNAAPEMPMDLSSTGPDPGRRTARPVHIGGSKDSIRVRTGEPNRKVWQILYRKEAHWKPTERFDYRTFHDRQEEFFR